MRALRALLGKMIESSNQARRQFLADSDLRKNGLDVCDQKAAIAIAQLNGTRIIAFAPTALKLLEPMPS